MSKFDFPTTCSCRSDDAGIAMPDFKHRPIELRVLEMAGMTPVCSDCRTMNISLREADGAVFRFKMTPKEARSFARGLLSVSRHISNKGSVCPQCGLQLSRSSGNPQAAGSPQEGQTG